jgi:hypothetical protein
MMRVFISHSSQDKHEVEAFAAALRDRGFDPWLDKWEIGPGDDIVGSINAGLEEVPAGIVVFSSHTRSSRWVEAVTAGPSQFVTPTSPRSGLSWSQPATNVVPSSTRSGPSWP